MGQAQRQLVELVPEKIISYSDGGARGNPGPAAIGVLLCDEKGTALFEQGETIGDTTNNVAEYQAVIKALELAHELGAHDINHHMDSELVTKQLRGEYRLKAEHLRPFFLKVKDLEKKFKKIIYTHVPREHPQMRRADRQVNRALDEAGY